MKTRRDGVDQPGSDQHAHQAQHRHNQSEQRAHRARYASSLFLIAFRQKPRVHGNEGSGEHPLAKHVLQEIRNSESGVEGVGGVRAQAEVVREHAQTRQADDPAEQNARCDLKRETPRALSPAASPLHAHTLCY